MPRWIEPSRGHADPRQPDRRRTDVYFDHDTYDIIRQRAVANRTSFAEEVRTLVEWGLESAKEAA